MQAAVLDLIARMTKVVVDLDRIVDRAATVAATNAEAREDAESLIATARAVRERVLEGLDEVKRPALMSPARRVPGAPRAQGGASVSASESQPPGRATHAKAPSWSTGR
jgi:hypothetical protein